MKKIPRFTDDTILSEYLKEPPTKWLIKEYKVLKSLDINNFDPSSEIVRKAEGLLFGIYSDFDMLANNVDNPGGVLFNFEMDDSKLPFMELLVDYYELESTIILEKMMESFYNFCAEYNCEIVSSNYMSNKLEKVQAQFQNVKRLEDSKIKLKELVRFKQYLTGLYFRDTECTTQKMILNESEVLINNLKELESLGFLEAESEKKQTKKNNSTFKVASKRKTDFIKLLSAMYETQMFVTENGERATNKQKLIETFGEFLGDDFSAYSTLLSQAKDKEEKTFLKPFKEIEKEALRYFNSVGE
jgi:hypothetical protein